MGCIVSCRKPRMTVLEDSGNPRVLFSRRPPIPVRSDRYAAL